MAIEKNTCSGGWLPVQRSSTECGVLLILCASYLSIGKPLEYTEDDTPNARRRIGCDLLRQSLGHIAGRAPRVPALGAAPVSSEAGESSVVDESASLRSRLPVRGTQSSIKLFLRPVDKPSLVAESNFTLSPDLGMTDAA